MLLPAASAMGHFDHENNPDPRQARPTASATGMYVVYVAYPGTPDSDRLQRDATKAPAHGHEADAEQAAFRREPRDQGTTIGFQGCKASFKCIASGLGFVGSVLQFADALDF
jgi:hypothetical protein